MMLFAFDLTYAYYLFQLVERPDRESQSPNLHIHKGKGSYSRKSFWVWNGKSNTFQFKLLSGVCAADVTFMGTMDIHEFHFTLDSAVAFHVALEHMDYEHTSDAFLLECAFSCHGKHPPYCGTAITQSGRIFQVPQPYQAIPSGRRSVGKVPKIIFSKGNMICSSHGFGAEPYLFYSKRKFKKQS